MHSERNFFVKEDGNAYTADEMLIKDIMVYIPKEIAEVEIREHFSKFGVVETVRLVADKEESNVTVSFAEASSATKALLQNNHILRGHRLFVEPFTSGNTQKQKICADAEMVEIPSHVFEIVGNSTNSLLSLNNDCLEYIYEHLNLHDRLNLSRANNRLLHIFTTVGKREYKTFDMKDLVKVHPPLKCHEVNYFFHSIGVYVEKLFYNYHQSIENHCVPMKCGYFSHFKYSGENVLRVLKRLHNLRELHVWGCMRDDFIEALSQMRSIKILNLHLYNISGNHLLNMTQLTSLDLRDCENIQSQYLIDIFRSMRELKTLYFRYCGPADVIEVMVENCQQLEFLQVVVCAQLPYKRLAQIQNLKRIELVYSRSQFMPPTEFFMDLITYKSNQLDTLKIGPENDWHTFNLQMFEHIQLISALKKLHTLFLRGSDDINDKALSHLCNLKELQSITLKQCLKITNASVLQLLHQCQFLRFINIRFCENINQELILEAIKILEQRTNAWEKPAIFHVYGTSIRKTDLARVPEYIAAEESSLLVVVFKVNKEDRIALDELWQECSANDMYGLR